VSPPELIVKHVYGWSEGYRLTFRPGFCLFGNRAGLEWLAARLRDRADRLDEAAPFRPAEPDDVEDLWETAPWNRDLSDELHLTLGSYADRHRTDALPRVNVTTGSRLTGPPTEQWAKLLGEMADWLAGRMAGVILSTDERQKIAESFDALAVAARDVATRIRRSTPSGP